MAKKRTKQPKNQNGENHFGLDDLVDSNSLSKLKEAAHTLKQEEKKQQEEAAQIRIKKRKEREKNKSFQELLDESDLDWKNYK
ncbi:DUF3886 domain-containing protein [Desertibacillus haloalkaliphilus]|uniref:DUF3886 domain-containing protein n=1 Tax=Desertibacillus haloalkaliphilus TaxID=1328930 RepID=UPI001C275A92|nr:DUF3886 domain-containing protein [Desertibacillus haloalkaliphilus]MBU8907331.1 DUF3886 domain-containing protein [Desertibacillus haloalkaliphilus]